MWVYLREYKSVVVVKQVLGLFYFFICFSWGFFLYWVICGYVVFDRVSMFVVGEGDDEFNDLF